ncbi:hypothetical protein [Helicobacter pylori]|uniref:hypothetical protein n=1 Tax=Helicobacter pylori TaxID=210 RepID=UPI000EB2B810|nr:hypothetical protein [Helicobacter pylori]
MRKFYGAVSVDNATIKSIKAKLGGNHYHKVSGSHQVGGVRKVFNTKKPFFIRQRAKSQSI